MILILNCGSQSTKWKLFDKNYKFEKEGKREIFDSKKYQEILLEELKKIAKSEPKIEIIGHRVVHGGEKFKKPTRINPTVLKELEKFNELAPLHNPFNILGIKTSQKIFPQIPNYAVFDTEFYNSPAGGLPEKAYTYPLPENIRKKYGFRRFGFHGISHEYVAKESAQEIGKPLGKLKIISCHLGGGCSITATKFGKVIDTSMGFTPMEGVVMMTRSGSIDPGIVLHLAKSVKRKAKNLDHILNYESGVKGICGISDMRDVLKAVKRGDKKAKLALEIFVYSIQKYISAYFGILGGCDILIFTGAIGFGSKKIRNMICRNLNISGKTKILAIKTDEELAIAKKLKK